MDYFSQLREKTDVWVHKEALLYPNSQFHISFAILMIPPSIYKRKPPIRAKAKTTEQAKDDV